MKNLADRPKSFIPGSSPGKTGPLSRFLPLISQGIASTWLLEKVASSAWVLDPFGTLPQLAVEAAQTGCRVLAAVNNPVTRFLFEMAAHPPGAAELRAVLADIAATHKGEERLEPHLRSLYRTECAGCGEWVMAEAFLWERGAPAPYARIYRCPYCGDTGERTATQGDAERAAGFAGSGLHRARALERVAPADDPDRAHAEEALEAYLPRAVYALFTLINKLDSFPPPRRRLLSALLLHACDQANSLWPYPGPRARPRQLTIPPRFRENNVWMALEEAVELWQSPSLPGEATLPVSLWPDHPPATGGICLFEGRLKDLAESAPEIEIGAILAALPRPNQAFWTLSALWAGWLWGRDAAAAFKNVLRRRRYDWGWHTSALQSALANLPILTRPGVPFLGLIGEAEPGFLTAGLVSARLAGLDLVGLTLRPKEGQAQFHFRTAKRAGRPGTHLEPSAAEASKTGRSDGADSHIVDLLRTTAQAHLQSRGEPASFLYPQAAALEGLLRSPKTGLSLFDSLHGTPAEVFSQVQAALGAAFRSRSVFQRYGGSERSLDVGHWWVKEEKPFKAATGRVASKVRTRIAGGEPPLADQVEIALVRFLQKHPGCTFDELDAGLCTGFPGLFTPELELVQVCLESYAEEKPAGEGRWQLSRDDSPRKRRAELARIAGQLNALGVRLGFQVETDPVGSVQVLWRTPDGEILYRFYPLASAVFGQTVAPIPPHPQKETELPSLRSVLVLPVERASLAAYKLRQNPRLRQAAALNWRFITFHQIAWLAEKERLDRELFEGQLSVEPLDEGATQIPLF